jgi:ribonuclease HIII
MPCWTIKKTSVNVSYMQISILEAGLKEAGFDVRKDQGGLLFSKANSTRFHRFEKGVLMLDGSNVDSLTNEVKRAYSVQAVKQTAQQFGWKVNTKAANQFAMTKRS